jgi:hypothetical protein
VHFAVALGLHQVEQSLAVGQRMLLQLPLVEVAVGQLADSLLVFADQLHQSLVVVGQFLALEQLEQFLDSDSVLAVGPEQELHLLLQQVVLLLQHLLGLPGDLIVFLFNGMDYFQLPRFLPQLLALLQNDLQLLLQLLLAVLQLLELVQHVLLLHLQHTDSVLAVG